MDKAKFSKLLRKLKTFNLSQSITDFTREQKDSKSIIDWHVTNKKAFKVNVRSDINIADHNFIILDLFSKHQNKHKIFRTFTDWSKYSSSLFKSHLSEINWPSFDSISNINDQSTFIKNSISNYLDSCLETKTIEVRPSLEWFTSNLMDLKNTKISARNKWNISKRNDDWKLYVAARNLYKNNFHNFYFCSVQQKVLIYKIYLFDTNMIQKSCGIR